MQITVLTHVLIPMCRVTTQRELVCVPVADTFVPRMDDVVVRAS